MDDTGPPGGHWDVLRPMPMTRAEVADLVRRARAAMQGARYVAAKSGADAATAQGKRRKQPTSRRRCAARLAAVCGISIVEAAADLGIAAAGARRGWQEVYPGVPLPRSRRLRADVP